MNDQSTKKICFNKSILLSLKAEVLKKQEEVIERKQLPQHKVENFIPPKVEKQQKHNGSQENQKTFQDSFKAVDIDELEACRKSKVALEKKAKLYEDLSESTENSTLSERFLVDFNGKKHNESEKLLQSAYSEDKTGNDSGGEDGEDWIEFMDCLGRTRKCLKTDLELYKKRDRELLKVMANEDKKDSTEKETVLTEKPFLVKTTNDYLKTLHVKWDEEKHVLAKKKDIHYQDLLFDEARIHGVGYYSFSTDEATRQKQMEELMKQREETLHAQRDAEERKKRRDELMSARIAAARARQRARAGLPPEEPQKNEKDFTTCLLEFLTQQRNEADTKAKEEEKQIREEREKERQKVRDAYVREWDIGKEGTDEKVKKFRELTQEEYVEQQRARRIHEFAPLQESTEVETNKKFDESGKIVADTNNSAHKTWAEVRPKTPPPVIQPIADETPKGLYFSTKKSNIKYKNFVPDSTPIENEVRKEDDGSEECQRVEKRKFAISTEVPPPPTYEYYGPLPKHSKVKKPFESDINEAYTQGAKSLEPKGLTRPLSIQKTDELFKPIPEDYQFKKYIHSKVTYIHSESRIQDMDYSLFSMDESQLQKQENLCVCNNTKKYEKELREILPRIAAGKASQYSRVELSNDDFTPGLVELSKPIMYKEGLIKTKGEEKDIPEEFVKKRPSLSKTYIHEGDTSDEGMNEKYKYRECEEFKSINELIPIQEFIKKMNDRLFDKKRNIIADGGVLERWMNSAPEVQVCGKLADQKVDQLLKIKQEQTNLANDKNVNNKGKRFPGLHYSPIKIVVINCHMPSQVAPEEEDKIKITKKKVKAEKERQKHLELLSACVNVENLHEGSRASPSLEKPLKTERTPSRLLNILKQMNNKPPRRTSDRTNNLEKEQRRSLSTERMCEKVKSYKVFSKKELKDKRTVNKIDKREHFQNFVKETTNKTMNNNKINFADINNEIIDANTEFYVSKETADDKPKTPPPPIIGPIEVGSPNGLFFSTTNTEIEDWIRFIPLPISPGNEVNDNETSLEDFESLHMSISSGDSPLKPSSPCVEMFQSIPSTHSDRESSFNSDLENNKESYLPSAQNTECKVFNDPIEEIWDEKVNKLLKKTREKWEQEALAKGKDINKQELKFDGKNIDSDVDDVSDYTNKGICYCRTRIEKKLDWRDVLKLEDNAEEHSKVNAEVNAERDLEEKEVKLDASSPTIQSNPIDNQHAVTTLPINKPREKLTMCLATFLEEEDHDCQKVKESGKKCVMVTFVT